MRYRFYTNFLIFIAYVFLLIFTCTTAYAEEKLRNYPAYIVIEDFEISDRVDPEGNLTASLGGGPNLAIQKGFSSELSMLLPRAKVVSVTLNYGPEMSDAKNKLKKFKEENDRRSREGLPLLPWENQIKPEDLDRFKPLMNGDFIITGMLSKVGDRYYLVTKIITIASNTVGFRKAVDFGNLLELPNIVKKISEQAGNALKDSFYCVDTEPVELKLGKNQTDAALIAHIVNLKNEPVDAEPVRFEPSKKEFGQMQPEKVSLNKGEAKSKYIVKQRKHNSVKVAIKPKGPCGKGITNGLWVPVRVGYNLKFEGDADAKVNIQEEGASFDLFYKTYFSDGEALIEIDEKSGDLTGTGTCYRKYEFGGNFGGDGISGGQQGKSIKEQIEVIFRGEASNNVAELYLKFKTGNLDAKNRIWADSESSHSEVNMEISKDKVESTATSEGKTFGPFVTAIEAEKSYEIGPIKLPLVEGKEMEFKFTPPSPIAGISQKYRIILKIVSGFKQ